MCDARGANTLGSFGVGMHLINVSITAKAEQVSQLTSLRDILDKDQLYVTKVDLSRLLIAFPSSEDLSEKGLGVSITFPLSPTLLS